MIDLELGVGANLTGNSGGIQLKFVQNFKHIYSVISNIRYSKFALILCLSLYHVISNNLRLNKFSSDFMLSKLS